MPEIIATGGGSDKDLKQNPLKAAWEKFSSLDKFSKTMVTTTVLFLVFATAITTITLSLRQYAGGGGIAKVEINPGIVTLNVGQKQALSTLAYDHNNNAVFSDVVYEWSTSSASSAATLSRTIGDITELTALRAGCSSLTVIARDGIATVTKSIIVAVSEPPNTVENCGVAITPTPRINPVEFNASDVDLKADNFYISLWAGQFYGSQPMSINSNIGSPSASTTTLETIWQENGVEMRMFMYFKADLQYKSWYLYELRTYDGDNPGDWVYYKVDDINGNPLVSAELGKPFNSGYLYFEAIKRSNESISRGSITFENIRLTPFKNYKTPTPIPTKTPPTITPIPPQPTTLELTAVADSYVRSDYPNKNYGGGKALRMDGKPTVKGYLKFDLRKLAGRKITSAKLGFYVLDVKGSASPGTQSLVRVANNNWTESSINYRNAPNTISVFSSHTNAKRNTFIYFDITNWVRENQGKFASMAVLNSSNNEAVLGSREQERASEMPTIVVYSEPDSTPTPTLRLTPTSTPTPF